MTPASQAAPQDLLLGTQIGPYRLDAIIGEGGMGVVYRGRDLTLDREVAVKVLFDVAEPENLERFLREARAAARLHGPNAVLVHTAGEVDGRPYYVMEYIDGTTLYARLRELGYLPWREATRFVLQAARGLREAAAVGVVHRDIKPHNLFLTNDGVVKVGDFGLAKLSGGDHQISQPGVTMGTPYYMSPEQGRGVELDFRSDMYSLGATFYHLLCGYTPFEGDEPMALILQHIEAEPPPLLERSRKVPRDLAAVVHRLLAKDPVERYPGYSELIFDLEAVMQGERPYWAHGGRTRVVGFRELGLALLTVALVSAAGIVILALL